MVEYLAFKPSL